ncbi:MAG: FkbM family methyltransferase [Lacibacter sp.]|jgi:FkbM family methyltransferase
MRKIVRILALVLLIRSKKQYAPSVRRKLIRTLLYLEWQSYLHPKINKPVVINMLHYKVHAYGYANLCVLFREIFVEEEYRYFNNIAPGEVLLDCGANMGLATLYLKWRFPDIIIHAFEPDPVAFSLLQQNIETNQLKQVFAYNKAAMQQAGHIRFYRSLQTKASLMMSTLKGRMNADCIEVEAIDFPQYVRQSGATLLKIDIEGAEAAIFEQMHTTGLGELRQIVMEYHHKIDGQKAAFARMLQILEAHQFEYNLITKFETPGQFQDILIYAWKQG